MKANTFFGLVASILLFVSCNSSAIEKVDKTKTNPSEVNLSDSSEDTKVIHLTTAEFKEKVFNYKLNQEWKYEGTIPCFVDFYADWCGPCKRVAPILDELSKEYDGKIIIYKIDTDKEKELASAFGISSIPTILFIPLKGEPQAAKGALPKETFVKAINEVLLK